MNTTENTEACPVDLPAPGTQIKIKCGDDTECPFAERASAEMLRGWTDFFKGSAEPSEEDSSEYARGWQAAKGHKSCREFYTWTFEGAEKGEDGGWYATLSRNEPRSYNDVMNGTGTGLGTIKVTERVRIA